MASVDMLVLRALRCAAAHDLWQTPAELGVSANQNSPLPALSVTSAIRRLRGKGFIINHVRRVGRTREYSLRKDITRI